MECELLPYEVQFKYLLSLSYKETIDYCITCRNTREICNDDSFWKRKARKHFNVSLDLVRAKDARNRYRILEEVLTAW